MSDLERQVGITSRLTREEDDHSYRHGEHAIDHIFKRENGNHIHVNDKFTADEMGDVVGGDVKTLTKTK